MTELEAKALAARLTRIWGIVRIKKTGIAKNDNHVFYFSGTAQEFSFRADGTEEGPLSFVLCRRVEGTFWANIYFHEGEVFGLSNLEGREKELQDQFASYWMPTFRRGYWLSGAAIECTAHEKLEWTKWLQEQEANDAGS